MGETVSADHGATFESSETVAEEEPPSGIGRPTEPKYSSYTVSASTTAAEPATTTPSTSTNSITVAAGGATTAPAAATPESGTLATAGHRKSPSILVEKVGPGSASKSASAPPHTNEGFRAAPDPPTEPDRPPHTVDAADLCAALGSDLDDGLSEDEVALRLERDGPNRIEGAKGLSVWQILMRQVSNSLTLVLVIVMILSFSIDDYIEGGVVAAVILLNIVVGLIQDYRAEKTIQSLYALSAPTCKVLRNGQLETLRAETLVKGDVVMISVGDVVPADLRLVQGINLSIDEALLTGESVPISKRPDIVLEEWDMPLGDRTNMVYSATMVTRGRACGIVTATGMDTEVGKIAGLLRKTNDDMSGLSTGARLWLRFKKTSKNILGLEGTPLQVKLSKFALLLFGLAITLVIIVFSANRWDIDDEDLIYGICVGVAVIPESLIAVLTITMAVGTKAMASGNVIVRKLSALEAVGGVTNICSDKTGTLTQGRMMAKKVWLANGRTVEIDDATDPYDPTSGKARWSGAQATGSKANTINDANEKEPDFDADDISSHMTAFVEAAALCNNASVTDGKLSDGENESITTATATLTAPNWNAVGEPTEIALQVLAMRFTEGKAGLIQSGKRRLVTECPFDSSCKRMSVVYDATGQERRVYSKGAVEALLPLLNAPAELKKRVELKADELASQGLRVLCVATRVLDPEEDASDRAVVESRLSFLGLAGLYDPPRLETAGAVEACRRAGISVHMVTGDHIKTATAIAYEVGILKAGEHSEWAVMRAGDFDAMTDVQVDALPALPLVLARCSPLTKVRMLDAMSRRRAYCIMTGDGVNDSPALKQANVGIAMGKKGSDVAKEAADMVLTDDNFSSIVTAIKEGRRLFDNIQKFLLHLLISNISQVLLLLVGLAFRDEDENSAFPLSPLEILWVNLITSSFLAIGLGLEEAQPDVLSRPPHDLRVGVFTRDLIRDKMVYGVLMGALCLAAFTSVAYGLPGEHGLGTRCNDGWNETCGVVYRARSTAYATLSWLLLVTAWEVKHFQRSLFAMNPELWTGPFAVFRTVWRNRFLFWAVAAGFVMVFPVIYLPTVNRLVFKHDSITWEWGVVVACLVVYIGCVEAWKAVKRRYRLGMHVAKEGEV